MKDWEIFEKNATSYLNNNVGIKGVWFKGGRWQQFNRYRYFCLL